MADNRQQRRAQMRKGKRPGETYADVLARKQLVAKAVEKSVHDENVKLEADIKQQRLMWECIVALNEAYGFGGVRAVRFMEAIDKVAQEVEAMKQEVDAQYAYEKLRQRASEITGIDIKYIHEEQMREARKYALADGFDFPPDEDL